MTQPDDWTQDRTDALGDLVWDKIIAERNAARAEADALREEVTRLRNELETVMRYVNAANELHATTFRE